MQNAALAFDERDVRIRIDREDETFGGARDEVGDDPIDRDALARDEDTGLTGRDELWPAASCAARTLELEHDGHLADRAVAADREHDGLRHTIRFAREKRY